MDWQICCSKTNVDGLNEGIFVSADSEFFGLAWRFSWLPMRLWVYGMGTACSLWRLLGVTRARVF
jgi:hypothetical protein